MIAFAPEVVQAAYSDPTAKEGWSIAVDIKPVRAFGIPVSLKIIRRHELLRDHPLLKLSDYVCK